jgi:hypothetical protein
VQWIEVLMPNVVESNTREKPHPMTDWSKRPGEPKGVRAKCDQQQGGSR